jgi:hypothetical protein
MTGGASSRPEAYCSPASWMRIVSRRKAAVCFWSFVIVVIARPLDRVSSPTRRVSAPIVRRMSAWRPQPGAGRSARRRISHANDAHTLAEISVPSSVIVGMVEDPSGIGHELLPLVATSGFRSSLPFFFALRAGRDRAWEPAAILALWLGLASACPRSHDLGPGQAVAVAGTRTPDHHSPGPLTTSRPARSTPPAVVGASDYQKKQAARCGPPVFGIRCNLVASD